MYADKGGVAGNDDDADGCGSHLGLSSGRLGAVLGTILGRLGAMLGSSEDRLEI